MLAIDGPGEALPEYWANDLLLLHSRHFLLMNIVVGRDTTWESQL